MDVTAASILQKSDVNVQAELRFQLMSDSDPVYCTYFLERFFQVRIAGASWLVRYRLIHRVSLLAHDQANQREALCRPSDNLCLFLEFSFGYSFPAVFPIRSNH